MSSMFYGASSFNGHLSSWDTSRVTDMGAVFYGASSFDGNVSSWDTSKVTTMDAMFYEATLFKMTYRGGKYQALQT